LDETFKTEYNDYIQYKDKIYQNPTKYKKYNSFYEYLYKIIMDKIKSQKICDDKGIPKNQKINENCLNNIKEIVEKEPFIRDKYFNKYQKFIVQLISFGQENLSQLEILKKSNIEEFKKIFMSQTIEANNEIQKGIKQQIEEVISSLDLFFRENQESKEGDSKEVDKFTFKIKENIKKIKQLLKNSGGEITEIQKELENKVRKSLKEREMVLADLLKKKDYEEILKEINEEIKKNFLELKGKFDNYIKDIDIKSKELIDDAKKSFSRQSI
jgi:BMFP domain-containing protein YqiC